MVFVFFFFFWYKNCVIGVCCLDPFIKKPFPLFSGQNNLDQHLDTSQKSYKPGNFINIPSQYPRELVQFGVVWSGGDLIATNCICK